MRMNTLPTAYAVLHDGNDLIIDDSLTFCFRFIARKMGKRMFEVTVAEAFNAGFEIRRI